MSVASRREPAEMTPERFGEITLAVEEELDRFFFKLLVPFPSAAELAEIATRTTGSAAIELAPVAGREELAAMRELSREVPLASHVMDLAVGLVMATHPEQESAPEEVRRY